MALKFSRLTRPAIRAMRAGERINEHGVGAERQNNGDTRYSINVMVDGQRIHRVVGRESEGVTREQAERLIEKLRTEAREGRLNLVRGRKLHRTFAEAAEEYIRQLETGGGKNLKPKRRHLRQHLVPYFGPQRADELKDFALKQYRKKRIEAQASQATVNREMATLSHMMKSGVKWKWWGAERVPVIEKENEPRKPITILSNVQTSALMTAALQDQDGRLWLFVAFGLNTAMRHREIVGVRYDQINFDTRRVFIPDAKAGEREQPITAALADSLRRQRIMEADSDGWVFPTLIPRQSNNGHRTSMARPFSRAVVRAGLDPDKVTPHTMRHTAITRLVKAGVDLPTIQKISGHKTLSMVLRYVHIHGKHIDAAISKIDTGYLGMFSPELHATPVHKEAAKGVIVAISSAKSRT